MSSSGLKVLFLLISCITLSLSKKCGLEDWTYTYTQCNNQGQRWLVSIPKNNETCDKDSTFRVPIKARDCGNPCDPGTYLNMELQECMDCPQGTYSQSSTIEIDNWAKMPSGFHSFSAGNDYENCTAEEWIPKGNFTEASVSKCESYLYYTVTLFKNGELTFEYLNPGNDLIFGVKISNENCKLSSADNEDSDMTKYLDSTDLSNWKRRTIPLKSGRNLIKWMAVGIESQKSTVKIKYIKISNTHFSTECIPCNAGYYSSSKSSKCTPCSMNTFSNKSGSSNCESCPSDKYSFAGSTACLDRPMCTLSDYSFRWTECDKNNQRQRVYFWVDPKLCNDQKLGSVQLPSESHMEICSPCPAGTYLNVTGSRCDFCLPGTYSNKPGEKCTPCGLKTQPVMGVIYDQWAHYLPNISFRCLKIDHDCNSNATWIYNGNNLQSSPAFDINLLQFDFEFDNRYNYSPPSHFSFEFSMSCTGYCILHLFLKLSKSSTTRINSWVNSTKRHTFNYRNFPEDSGQIIWLFSRSKQYQVSQKSNDFIQIFSIKMTQLKNVGAVQCKYCDPLSPSTECSDCGQGKYFSLATQNCTDCSPGYILKNRQQNNENDCIKCGEGLIAVNGTVCLPNIHYISSNRNHYDLTNLKGTHSVIGNNLFTVHGQQYHHLFKITLFSDTGVLSICKNNATIEKNLFEDSGPMCRSTLVSNKLENNTVFAMQSILMADEFVRAFQSNSSGKWKEMNDSLISKGFPGDATGMDLHFEMKSEKKTENCKEGYGTTVTLRCDPSLTENRLMLPSKCAMETCDGCNFHFLLKSKYSCPDCREEDYSIMTSECINGQQERHYFPPRYCLSAPPFDKKVTLRCPLFTMKMEIGILVTAGILIFLIGLVVYCHKKNKKLEYKYMRLISGNDDNDNILNGAESCAVHDDDEDEDDVKIKTNSKSGKIFAKYNKPSQYKIEKSSMERINLSENQDFDI